MNPFSIPLDAGGFAVFVVAGLLTGIINTLAGSGSLVTLPIFQFMCGLPATVANGTNRVGVILQSAVAVWSFDRHGNVDFKGAVWLIVPSVIGSIIGAGLASVTGEREMDMAIGFLMVFMLFVLFFQPKNFLKPSEASLSNNRKPSTLIIFFLIGIYGGFIQAGVGIFLLAALVLAAKYDLIKGNGVKSLAVVVFNIPAIIIFAWQNKVHWGLGFTMAICQATGALIGARFANKFPNANTYIRYLLMVIVVASAAKYLGLYDWLLENV
ncbi:MAG: sulfite exporter TauE/SafE family protein [Bacteroidota bacterium]